MSYLRPCKVNDCNLTVIEIQYFPTLFFFQLFAFSEVRVEKCDSYQKRSFRNKCVICNSLGPQVLTVPLLKGKHERQPVTDVRISYDENWPRQHLQSLKSAYGKAPYFDFFFGKLSATIESRPSFLFDLNVEILTQINEITNLCPDLIFTEAYLSASHYDQDMRDFINPQNYASLNPTHPYEQVFADRLGFLSNLSILDLIFCLGPASRFQFRRPDQLQ